MIHNAVSEARKKHMEELKLLKWKRGKEVEKAWQEFDLHWGKRPARNENVRENETDEEMDID